MKCQYIAHLKLSSAGEPHSRCRLSQFRLQRALMRRLGLPRVPLRDSARFRNDLPDINFKNRVESLREAAGHREWGIESRTFSRNTILASSCSPNCQGKSNQCGKLISIVFEGEREFVGLLRLLDGKTVSNKPCSLLDRDLTSWEDVTKHLPTM